MYDIVNDKMYLRETATMTQSPGGKGVTLIYLEGLPRTLKRYLHVLKVTISSQHRQSSQLRRKAAARKL